MDLRTTVIQMKAVRDQIREIAIELDGVLKVRPYSFEEVYRHTQEIAVAYELLCIHQQSPILADYFPDGSPSPLICSQVPTPKQVIYLEALQRGPLVVDGPRKDLAPLGQLPPSRGCEGKVGCAATSLRWTERAVCFSHATQEEKECNRAAKAIYDQAITND